MRALILSLILACSSALADDVATIVAIRGTVFADTELVHQGSKIKEGATVMAYSKSFAIMQFFDGATITVRPSSELVISKYKEDEVELNLVGGGLRVVTGAIARNDPETYKLHAGTVLMGVRGTQFSVQLID